MLSNCLLSHLRYKDRDYFEIKQKKRNKQKIGDEIILN